MDKGELLKKLSVVEGEKAIGEAIALLNAEIENNSGDAALFFMRAELFYKLNRYGEAINDYMKVLELDPLHKEAAGKIEMIKTILRFHNTDIYANPNTNMDPWLE